MEIGIFIHQISETQRIYFYSMQTLNQKLTRLKANTHSSESTRLQSLAEERIPNQISRVVDGNPEIDYLIALSTDYVLAAQQEMNVDFRKVEAALQLIQQSYRLEAHMYAREFGTLNMPLSSTQEDIPVYTMPRRSHRVWEMGYYFGLICRSRMLISDFRMLPYTRQFIQNNIFDEFRVIYYHFLRQIETPQADIFHKRSEQVLTKIPMNYATHYQAYFPLWKPVLAGDEAGLKNTLKEVIEFRKLFNNHKSIETLIPLVGILSYAHDMGMEFDTYDLPVDLIKGHYSVGIDEKLELLFEPKA